MKMFILLVTVFSFVVHAEEAEKPQVEEKLKFSQIFTEIPSTSKSVFKTSFSKEALPYWGVILGSTAILYNYDEQLYTEAKKQGRNLGIGNDDNTKPVVTAYGQQLLRLPTDTGSFMYFLGDGWTHAAIGAGFVATGAITKDNYDYNTGIILWHGMVTSTIFNQALKRSFGRESPNVKTSERGSWHMFPSAQEYNSKTGSYDAMPTGHLMTATLTFTVLSERYPEYRHVIYPVGAVWLTALGFEMMNNGVHWASDYPLGIAMGYVFGKAACKIVKTKETKEDETAWNIMPSPSSGNFGVFASKRFY